MERRDPIVRRVDREKKGFESFSHPLNPERSQMRGFSLSDAVGLTRIAVHLAVLPPGKESFVYHSHAVEEEWLYVLAGRGRIEIDGELRELVAGDFVGFATPSAAHQLRNPYGQDLTYLTGGERKEVEIAEFPRLGKIMVRVGFEAMLYPKEAGTPMRPYVGDLPGK
ncbi:MAG: cupin domain-containing protein [Chloroflexi bacterium]|nr:MAG: cupin domain-containing protein [Chloroflexota bacterium]